jgi:hypothetical protein
MHVAMHSPSCFPAGLFGHAARAERILSAEKSAMGTQRQLRRARRRLDSARLYAGLNGNGIALERVAQLERMVWRLERLLLRERRAA